MISTMNMNTSAVCDSVTRAEFEALQARVAELEAGPVKAKPVKVKAEKVKEKAEKVKSELNLSSDDMGRMDPADINDDLCQARICDDKNKDDSYKPAIFKETQCQRAKKVGDLCTFCNKAFEKAEALGDEYTCYKKDHGKWFGLITEDPLPSCHMLGTAWAEERAPKKKMGADGSASESGSSEQMETTSETKSVAETVAETKATKAEKAAAKVAEKAAKEAATAVKKAAAEVAKMEKAKAKEAKEAEKLAKAESKESKPKAKESKAKSKTKETKVKEPKETKPKGKKANAPDVMPAKADDEEVKEAYQTVPWDDEVLGMILLAKKDNGDCYTVDELTSSIPQAYYGHMTEEGLVDKTISEQTDAESDSE
jgi:colicin import membrane protein